MGVKSHLEGRKALLIAPKRGFWAKKSKISNINISGVYEAICMKFSNLISLTVKSRLKGRRALRIAPKWGLWDKKS